MGTLTGLRSATRRKSRDQNSTENNRENYAGTDARRIASGDVDRGTLVVRFSKGRMETRFDGACSVWISSGEALCGVEWRGSPWNLQCELHELERVSMLICCGGSCHRGLPRDSAQHHSDFGRPKSYFRS